MALQMIPVIRLVAVCVVLCLSSSSYGQRQRHFEFHYEVTVNDLPDDAERVDVWLPVPPGTAEQQILSMNIFSPVEGKLDRDEVYGNRFWHATALRPPPRSWRIRQVVQVVRKEQEGEYKAERAQAHTTAAIIEQGLDVFLRPNRLVPITERFRSIAAEATQNRGGPLARARALYDFVQDRMSYDKSGTGWGRGDANYACEVGKGNCTDYHSLFIALARTQRIPARIWIGFPLPAAEGRGTVAGYHCWAEFWVEQSGWIPVDISEADKHPQRKEYFFGRLDENRIAYTLGRDLVLSPPHTGPPLNFFIYPYVEVDSRRWEKIECRFFYNDLP